MGLGSRATIPTRRGSGHRPAASQAPRNSARRSQRGPAAMPRSTAPSKARRGGGGRLAGGPALHPNRGPELAPLLGLCLGNRPGIQGPLPVHRGCHRRQEGLAPHPAVQEPRPALQRIVHPVPPGRSPPCRIGRLHQPEPLLRFLRPLHELVLVRAPKAGVPPSPDPAQLGEGPAQPRPESLGPAACPVLTGRLLRQSPEPPRGREPMARLRPHLPGTDRATPSRGGAQPAPPAPPAAKKAAVREASPALEPGLRRLTPLLPEALHVHRTKQSTPPGSPSRPHPSVRGLRAHWPR